LVFSGSPAYDSVRPLSYQEADVFLLCYKISDPISLYNVKNKWIRELRSQRPDVPVILCGCHADLRHDPATLHHLSKTGRTPVSSDQALAICCEIQAVNYVETSARFPMDAHVNAEAFELCALAAIKNNNNQTM
jgi:GTPase SAR1 family protein